MGTGENSRPGEVDGELGHRCASRGLQMLAAGLLDTGIGTHVIVLEKLFAGL